MDVKDIDQNEHRKLTTERWVCQPVTNRLSEFQPLPRFKVYVYNKL